MGKEKATGKKATGKKADKAVDKKAEKKESSAFKRRWPLGVEKTKKDITTFIKENFPKSDKLPTRMEVIRAGIKEDFNAQSMSDAMETIFENNEWGPREVDSARRREFRNLENPKEKKPRGRPALTEEEAAAKAKEKAEKSQAAKDKKAKTAADKKERAAKAKADKKAKDDKASK